MSEVIGVTEQLNWRDRLRDTPLDGLAEDLTIRQQAIADTNAELATVRTERDAAVEVVQSRFRPQLAALQRQARELEELVQPLPIVEELRQLQIDKMLQVALQLEVEAHSMDAQGFAEQLGLLLNPTASPELKRYAPALENWLGFTAFYQGLLQADGPLDVAVIQLDWFQQYDYQAEHEGRDGSLGTYQKQCSVYKATVTPDQLTVKVETVENGDFWQRDQAVAIALDLSQARYVTSADDWGSLNAKFEEVDGDTELLLSSGKSKNNRWNQLEKGVDWARTAKRSI